MKRITTFILAIIMCIAFSVVSFADNIYIVEDDEPVFVPEVTTTAPPETTTVQPTTEPSGGSIIGDMGQFEDYLGGFKDFISGGIDSIVGDFGDFDFNFGETTTSQIPPSIDNSDRPTYSNQSEQMVQGTKPTTPENELLNEVTTAVEENTTAKNEVHSVLIVNGEKDDDGELSGSTLTLIVFIAAIVLLILVAAIVLVVMTKRTEHNSAVMDKSTIPGVAKPRGMSNMMNDNISDDGNDYGNITYWND